MTHLLLCDTLYFFECTIRLWFLQFTIHWYVNLLQDRKRREEYERVISGKTKREVEYFIYLFTEMFLFRLISNTDHNKYLYFRTQSLFVCLQTRVHVLFILNDKIALDLNLQHPEHLKHPRNAIGTMEITMIDFFLELLTDLNLLLSIIMLIQIQNIMFHVKDIFLIYEIMLLKTLIHQDPDPQVLWLKHLLLCDTWDSV